jgi:alcohol dehydrogenase class IV
MGLDIAGMDEESAAVAAMEAIAETFGDLGLPLRLADVSVPLEGIQLIAEDAMTDFALHRNIRPVNSPSQLVELLLEAW